VGVDDIDPESANDPAQLQEREIVGSPRSFPGYPDHVDTESGQFLSDASSLLQMAYMNVEQIPSDVPAKVGNDHLRSPQAQGGVYDKNVPFPLAVVFHDQGLFTLS